MMPIYDYNYASLDQWISFVRWAYQDPRRIQRAPGRFAPAAFQGRKGRRHVA